MRKLSIATALISILTVAAAYADWKGCQDLSEPQDALKSCSQVIAKGGEHGTEQVAKAHLHRGLMYLKQRKFDLALGDFSTARKLQPDMHMACTLIGAVHYQRAKYKAAVDQYSDCINLVPDNGMAYDARGQAQTALKNYTAAISDYSIALKKHEKDIYRLGDTLLARGKAYQYSGKKAQAITDYAEVIRLFPKLPLGYIQRAQVFESLGHLDDAIADYREILRIAPKNAIAKKGLVRLGKQ